MATNTYVPIATYTVPSAAANYTFTSISGAYTDLVLVCNGAVTTGSVNWVFQVGNGSVDTAANYSQTDLWGTGSLAQSSRGSSQTNILLNSYGYLDTVFAANVICHIMNYSNTTTYKTILSRANNAANGVHAGAGLWRSTSAINTIKIATSSSTFVVGTTFTLYGILAEGGAKATGGYVTSDANYYYHTFLASGTFTPVSTLSCDVLVVAGGGGGGGGGSTYASAGGGGAGGYRTSTALSVSTATTVTVGSGGAGGLNAFTTTSLGTKGNNSVFSSITSSGGGAGTGFGGAVATSGGSGGGGAGYSGVSGAQTGAAGNAGTYSPVEGYAGGNGGTGATTNAVGGGGGGAGGLGVSGAATALNSNGVTGGIGSNSLSSWATVTNTGVSGYYASGGGGGSNGGTGGFAGTGGGGAGGTGNANGSAATANTGSGGGGAGGGASGGGTFGGAGGSGIVIVRYAKV